MATVNIDSKLLEALQQSTCFGIAHDETVPECKQCDVKSQCKVKTEGGNIPTPTAKPKSTKPSTTATKETTKPPTPKKSTTTKSAPNNKPKAKTDTKAKSSTSDSIPDFKPMQLEELKALASERNVEWKDYGNDNITRMRLIMALKKSY